MNCPASATSSSVVPLILRYTPSTVQIPPTIPVMLLSGCCLMPHGMLPLFIFEPRYREMLRHAIKSERIFCVAARKPFAEGEDDNVIEEFTTAGMIRACVHHDDGTSHLMLQGIQRIRLTGWVQREPFRIANIEPVLTTVSAPAELTQLRAALLERACSLLTGPRAMENAAKTASIQCNEVLADFVASNFISDPVQRQTLLGLADLNERLRCLSDLLAPAG